MDFRERYQMLCESPRGPGVIHEVFTDVILLVPDWYRHGREREVFTPKQVSGDRSSQYLSVLTIRATPVDRTGEVENTIAYFKR